MDLEHLIEFMRENEIIKLKTDEYDIEITKESIARHHLKRTQKNVAHTDRKIKDKKIIRKDELKEFIYGKDKIDRKEMGELYGV